jgi:YNFM family putative membrane transporter
MFFYAVGLLVFGTLSDVIGRKSVFVIGMLLFSLTSLLVAVANSELSLIVTRGLQGFAGGSFAPVAFAYTFDLYKGKVRTLILTLINTGFLVAGIAGQLISSSITEVWGWQYVFYFFSLTYFIVFLFSSKLLPHQNKKKVNQTGIPVRQFVNFFRSRDLVLCYVITLSLLLTPVSFYDTLSQYLLPVMSNKDLFFIRLIALTGTVFSLLGGTIISKFGVKGSFYIGFSFLICSLFFMIIFPVYIVILFSSIFLVAAISLLIPSIITLIGTIEQQARGSAIALYSFTLLIGASFGSLLTSIFEFQGVLLFLLLYGTINLFLINKISFPI